MAKHRSYTPFIPRLGSDASSSLAPTTIFKKLYPRSSRLGRSLGSSPSGSTIMMTETSLRTLIRALTYRILAILTTALFTGISSAVTIHFWLILIHYVHERAWLKLSWGSHPK